jgi:hypothetical protein
MMQRLAEGQLHIERLDRDYLCIVHVAGQMPGVLHQVAIRRDKVNGELIRLGETPNDEFIGWRFAADVQIIAILGELVIEGVNVKVVPREQNLAEMEYGRAA